MQGVAERYLEMLKIELFNYFHSTTRLHRPAVNIEKVHLQTNSTVQKYIVSWKPTNIKRLKLGIWIYICRYIEYIRLANYQ
jgi:hypothetical protein